MRSISQAITLSAEVAMMPRWRRPVDSPAKLLEALTRARGN